MGKKIRVLIIDDSASVRQTLVRVTELERRMTELHGPATPPPAVVERPVEPPAPVYPPM